MDKTTENIGAELNKLAGKVGPLAVYEATVLSIDEDDTITVVLDTDLELDQVRLKSVVQGTDKVILEPKVNTRVQIARIEDSDEFFVVAVEEITRIYSKTSSAEYEQSADGFLIKRGTENLYKILSDLIDACVQERHNTNQGPTIQLTPTSQQRFNSIKNRLANLLKNA